MRRRDFLRVVAGTAGGLYVSGCVSPIEKKAAGHVEKPNIIFILADDLGYADLGCYGAPKIETPHIDHMAAEGMRFTSFYTQPVCGPTRTAIMTGCYPMPVAEYANIKRHHPFVHVDEILIPEVLRQADRILFPILKSFNECGLQGAGDNDNETNDWRAWDGTPWGYEGLLVDNYLVVKAVLVRQGLVDPEWGFCVK